MKVEWGMMKKNRGFPQNTRFEEEECLWNVFSSEEREGYRSLTFFLIRFMQQ